MGINRRPEWGGVTDVTQDRFDSWKEISVYLKRDVRTLHRWERDEGLPVHRHLHNQRSTVYAYRTDLDQWRQGRQKARGAAPTKRGRRVFVAVLPFENLGGNPDDEYFSDGLTEDVITHLGRSPSDLGVIARTSVTRYKGTQKRIAEVGRELGVAYVLEGRTRRVGRRIRLTVRLVQAADETQLWAESYDRELRDILALQGELATSVAQRVVPHLSDAPKSVALAPSVNAGAFEAYLKGRFHWYKLSARDLDTALEYFQSALKKDPTFALAYEGIAGVWLMRGDAGLLPPGETLLKAKTAALRALHIDDTLAAAHVALANIKFCNEWDWRGAEEEFQHAIRLNASSADAHLFYSDFLMSLGRERQAVAEMERALDLDPFNSFCQCFSAWHLVYRHEYGRAIEQLCRIVEHEPQFSSAHLGLWGAFAAAEQYDDALASARRFFTSLKDSEICAVLADGFREGGYRLAMVRGGHVLAERARTTHVSAIRVARLYAQGSDVDRALNWLERAYERRESPLVHLNVGWDWRELRRRGRFQDLVHSVGLPRGRQQDEKRPKAVRRPNETTSSGSRSVRR